MGLLVMPRPLGSSVCPQETWDFSLCLHLWQRYDLFIPSLGLQAYQYLLIIHVPFSYASTGRWHVLLTEFLCCCSCACENLTYCGASQPLLGSKRLDVFARSSSATSTTAYPWSHKNNIWEKGFLARWAKHSSEGYQLLCKQYEEITPVRALDQSH